MSKEPFNLGEVNWDDMPPVDDQRFIPIYTAQPLVTGTLTVIGDALVGVRTHYVNQRTIPCVAPHGCDCQRRPLSSRWKGYFACWDRPSGRLCMLEVTHEAARNCNVQLFPVVRSLRGSVVKFWRIGPARNAPGRIELFNPITPEELPLAFDVRAHLCRLWHGRNRS